MLFDGWTGLLRALLLGTSAYLMLILMLRLSGKRTLAKLSAFDLVVTVALGSTLATVLLSKDVPLAEGVVGLALLVLLQYLIATLAMRSRKLEGLVKSSPRQVLRNGEFDMQAMNDERVTRADVKAAIRSSGNGDLASIAAVVLEADGTLSVIPRESLGSGSALPGQAEA